MMDAYERAELERAKRNALVVAELDAVCRRYGARAHHVPASYIIVVLERGVRFEWRWDIAARASALSVCAISSHSTHLAVTPVEAGEALQRVSALLVDPAFTDALAVALSRVSEGSARALAERRRAQREAQERQSYVSEHGG